MGNSARSFHIKREKLGFAVSFCVKAIGMSSQDLAYGLVCSIRIHAFRLLSKSLLEV